MLPGLGTWGGLEFRGHGDVENYVFANRRGPGFNPGTRVRKLGFPTSTPEIAMIDSFLPLFSHGGMRRGQQRSTVSDTTRLS